jgi:hypothetical protein
VETFYLHGYIQMVSSIENILLHTHLFSNLAIVATAQHDKAARGFKGVARILRSFCDVRVTLFRDVKNVSLR